jgi:hypothetical protein
MNHYADGFTRHAHSLNQRVRHFLNQWFGQFSSCKFSCDGDGELRESDRRPPLNLLILLMDALCACPTCGSDHRKIYRSGLTQKF